MFRYNDNTSFDWWGPKHKMKELNPEASNHSIKMPQKRQIRIYINILLLCLLNLLQSSGRLNKTRLCKWFVTAQLGMLPHTTLQLYILLWLLSNYTPIWRWQNSVAVLFLFQVSIGGSQSWENFKKNISKYINTEQYKNRNSTQTQSAVMVSWHGAHPQLPCYCPHRFTKKKCPCIAAPHIRILSASCTRVDFFSGILWDILLRTKPFLVFYNGSPPGRR